MQEWAKPARTVHRPARTGPEANPFPLPLKPAPVLILSAEAPAAIVVLCQAVNVTARPSLRRRGKAGMTFVPRIAKLALVGLAVAGLAGPACAAGIMPGNGGTVI